jgi:hypothetical protein
VQSSTYSDNSTLRNGMKDGSSGEGGNFNRSNEGPRAVEQLLQAESKPKVLRKESPQRPITPPYKAQLDQERTTMEHERRLYLKNIDDLNTKVNSLQRDLDREVQAARTHAQSLSNKLAEAHQKSEKLADEARTLQRERRILNDANAGLRDTNQQYDRREKGHIANTSQLREKVASLTSQLSVCKTERDNYYHDNVRLREEKTGLIGANQRCKEQIGILEADVEALTAAKTALAADNEGLRSDIFKIGSTVNPLHDEDFYVRSFESLKADVEMWVAKQAKDNATEVLSIGDEQRLLQHLAGLGPAGIDSSHFLAINQLTGGWYNTKRSRIPLLRHLFAVFLLDKILAPFAAGAHLSFSKALIWIENDIISRGFCLSLQG